MDSKTLAVLGLVFGFIMPPVGIILSAVALSKFKQSGETDGKGFAIAGLVIGIVIVAVIVLVVASVVGCLGLVGCALADAVSETY